MPQITVIVPAYNAGCYVDSAIRSVLTQSFEDWELIVIDDGSTDDTAAIASESIDGNDRAQVVSQENRGVAGARNRGIDLANNLSQYVLFLDADDVLEQYALQTLYSKLSGHPECPAAYGLARYIDEAGAEFWPGRSEEWTRTHRRVPRLLGTRLLRDDEPTAFESLVAGNSVQSSGAALVRRAALEQVGPYDESLRQCEDWDMWLRLSRIGPLAFVPTIVLGYRKHGANMTNDRQALAESQAIVRATVYSRAMNDARARKQLVAMRRANERHLAISKLGFALADVRTGRFRSAILQLRYCAGHTGRSLRLVL